MFIYIINTGNSRKIIICGLEMLPIFSIINFSTKTIQNKVSLLVITFLFLNWDLISYN